MGFEKLKPTQGHSWLSRIDLFGSGRDNFKHVYSFEKDEYKVALVLLKPSLISKPSNREENTLLIQGGKLEEIGEDFVEHVILGFSLIGKGNFQEFPFVIDL